MIDQIRYLTHGNADQVQAVEATARLINSPDLKSTDEVPFLRSTTYGAYWLSLRAYDPVVTADKLELPILVLQGERDYQVTLKDYALWQKAFVANDRVTLFSFPRLNHLFIEGSGQGLSVPADYKVPGHVSEEVLLTISDWITRDRPIKN